MHQFRFEPVTLPPNTRALRDDVRAFIGQEVAAGSFTPGISTWASYDTEFSRKCGERGYIGMRWPKRYGGRERTALERYVVTEELLAAGAPVGAHWVADRQSGNQILRHGSERAKDTILPRIAAGRCFFAIGMSEPDTGSDLAGVSTRAVKVDGGWRITGTKIWTSYAHIAHYLIALARSAPKSEARHEGLTQFIVDLSAPGVTVRPIRNILGDHEFNEVVFDAHFVPDDMVLGEVGAGWAMVTSELAYERSEPDRFLTTFQLLSRTVDELGKAPSQRAASDIGRLVAHLVTLRRMSSSIAGLLQRGEQPMVEAAIVKDVGTTFEREIPEVCRQLIDAEPTLRDDAGYAQALGLTMLRVPRNTIMGGTREILRGMIARGLGLR